MQLRPACALWPLDLKNLVESLWLQTLHSIHAQRQRQHRKTLRRDSPSIPQHWIWPCARRSYEAEVEGLSSARISTKQATWQARSRSQASRRGSHASTGAHIIQNEHLMIASRDITQQKLGRQQSHPTSKAFGRKRSPRRRCIGNRLMKDSNFLKEHNGRLMWHPMTSPQDSIDNPPKIITGSDGVTITDVDGHSVVDGVGGLWNVNLGYSCQPVKDAMTAQLDKLPYYSTFRGTSNDVAIELSYELNKFFEPDGMSRAFFTSGGSDSGGERAAPCAPVSQTARRSGSHEVSEPEERAITARISVAHPSTATRTSAPPTSRLLPGCFHIPAPYTRTAIRSMRPIPRKLAQLCVQAVGRRDRLPRCGHDCCDDYGTDPWCGRCHSTSQILCTDGAGNL